MDWTTVAAVVTALGGREVFAWLANRRAYAKKEEANARKEEASAEDAEVSVYEKQIERLDQRLTARDAKVDQLYEALRDEQRKNLDLTEKVNELELDKKVLMFQKCEVRGCAQRQPPGTY